jgi:multiple sugar transport system ATP-binding protein
MGRDISIVSKNEKCEAPVVRSIIDSDQRPDESLSTVAFNLRPGKVHLFEPETGARIRFGKEK